MKKRQRRLILENIALARELGRRYWSIRYDAVAEAEFALTLAAVNWKPGAAKFSTYAFTVIRNHLLDLRKKRNLKIINVDWQQVEANDEELAKFSKFLARDDSRLGRLERREAKKEFLARLNPLLTAEERRIINLLVRGKSQTEIGLLLGISQATVNRRVSTVRKKVREMEAGNGGS